MWAQQAEQVDMGPVRDRSGCSNNVYITGFLQGTMAFGRSRCRLGDRRTMFVAKCDSADGSSHGPLAPPFRPQVK